LFACLSLLTSENVRYYSPRVAERAGFAVFSPIRKLQQIALTNPLASGNLQDFANNSGPHLASKNGGNCSAHRAWKFKFRQFHAFSAFLCHGLLSFRRFRYHR
jgi:hypothetical protein